MVLLHHVKPHAGVVDNIQRQIIQVHVLPGDGEGVVVLVVPVIFVLPQAFFLGGLQGPVDGDEVALDQLALVVGDLDGSHAAAKLHHHLAGEPLGHIGLLLPLGLEGPGLGCGSGSRGGSGLRSLIGCHFHVLLICSAG